MIVILKTVIFISQTGKLKPRKNGTKELRIQVTFLSEKNLIPSN